MVVVPGSIEILREDHVRVEDLERADPLVGDPGWRRVDDLEQAMGRGLLAARVEREGGTWDDMFDALARRAQPLVDAGWLLVPTEREESWEYGDSVFCDLERNGITIELEFYEHEQLVAYPLGDGVGDGDVTEPYCSIPASTVESSRQAFERHGGSDVRLCSQIVV